MSTISLNWIYEDNERIKDDVLFIIIKENIPSIPNILLAYHKKYKFNFI